MYSYGPTCCRPGLPVPEEVCKELSLPFINLDFLVKRLFERIYKLTSPNEVMEIVAFLKGLHEFPQVEKAHLVITRRNINIWINLDNESLGERDPLYEYIYEVEEEFGADGVEFIVFNNLCSVPENSHTVYERGQGVGRG